MVLAACSVASLWARREQVPYNCWYPGAVRNYKTTALIAFKKGSFYIVLAFASYLWVAAVLSSVTTVATAATKAAPKAGGAERIKQLESALERAVKKGEADAEADALYDLAKACFEAGDLARAEAYMRNSLSKEANLRRPDSAIRTRVALATILVAAKRNADAGTVYREALALSSQEGRSEQSASILGSMGALALVAGNTDEAEDSFKKALELAVKSENSASHVNALINLSVVERSRNDAAAAMTYLEKAIPLLKEVSDNRALGAALMELGATRSDLGRHDEALDSYKQAAEIFEGEFDTVSQGKVLLAMGQVLIKKNRPKEAGIALAKARDTLKDVEPRAWYIDSLTSLGTAESETGQYTEADAAYQEAMQLAVATGSGAKRRAILSEMGYSYLLRGSPERALNKFQDAYSLISAENPADSKPRGVLLTDIAMCYKALGQLSAAIHHYEQACANFAKANDQSSRATALSSLAVAYLDSGIYSEFQRNYDQARLLLGMVKNNRDEALLAYNMAQYNLLKGHTADSVPLYEEALAKLRGVHDSKGEGQVLRGLGLAYILLGRVGKALAFYQQAQVLAESGGSIEAQWDCALGMGKAYKALGQFDQSAEQLRRAADLVEKERAQLSRDTFKTFNMDLRQDCFTELIDVLLRSNKADEALEVAERGRARAFLDLLEGRRSRRPGDAMTAGFTPIKIDEGGEKTPAAPLRPQMVAQNPEAGSRAVQVIPRASAIVEASAISPINALPPSLEEIKTLVNRSGSTFVEYYVLPDKLVSWVVHPDGKIETPPPTVITRRQLSDKITNAYRSIVGQPKTPAEVREFAEIRTASLKELHQLLMEPVLPYLPKTPEAIITIVPHGPLFSVPFAALIEDSGRFLVEDHTLGYVPAIGVLRATQKLAEESAGEPDRLLAFGNPITKRIAFLGALPYAEKEVHHIADLFGKPQSTVEIGQQASKPAFRKLAPTYSVLHLATHGLIDEEHPMESALVLAPEGTDDGLLAVRDILELPQLKARMVALSACQTGRGKITGDGVVGLSRAFVIAGTPSVLVSQWNVDDVLTEYQMVAFYKSYLAKEGKAKALRQAQLKTIDFMERPSPGTTPTPGAPRANPRYWAAFQLIGNCL